MLPIGNGPRLITKDVNYTQIAVERVTALDNNVYDVIFTGTGESVCLSVCHSWATLRSYYISVLVTFHMTTAVSFFRPDKGVLHKSVVYEGEVHTVEEIQLLKNAEAIKTLLLSTQGVRHRLQSQ